MKNNINGVLLLDKPVGISSNAALQKVKHLFTARKAGHTGSLDPLATGILPVCFGEATKLSRFLLNADKRYEVTACLGVKTATADSEGEVIATQTVTAQNIKHLNATINKFRGQITQIPPMYSAIKHQGQPLYKLARKGIEVKRKARQVTIYELKLYACHDSVFSLHVHCSKGTYIRSLIDDIGDRLGCGAHVTALRRLTVGSFVENEMIAYPDLCMLAEKGQTYLQERLLPLDCVLRDWPVVQLDRAASQYIGHGQAIRIGQCPDAAWVGLRSLDNTFIALAEVLPDGRVAPRRLIHL